MSQQTVELGDESNIFARGGNRNCFIFPGDPDKCVKTLRADRLPAAKRREKGVKGWFRPLVSFDDNQQEYLTFLRIRDLYGSSALRFTPACHGMVQTDHGNGLVTELIRDFDGAISMTLKQFVWLHGDSAQVRNAIAAFQQSWETIGLPSRNLLLHNIVNFVRAGMAPCGRQELFQEHRLFYWLPISQDVVGVLVDLEITVANRIIDQPV